MAKTTRYGLRFNHPTEFRRTVSIGAGKSVKRVQLLFVPGKPLDLTQQEIEGCRDLIDGGLVVPWETDARGRQARPKLLVAQVPASQESDDETNVVEIEADEEDNDIIDDDALLGDE